MAAIRQSNFELLRIISILLIVSMHILGNTFHTRNLLNRELILAVNTLGNTGVTLFILLSGYFGIRFNIRKLFKLIAAIWFYSVFSYILEVRCLQVPFTWAGLASSLVPVLSKKYWFMTCYVVLYCFSPYLNRLAAGLSRESFRRLLLIWGFFFAAAPTFLFFEIQNDTGKGVINVILAYLIGQYIQTYGFPQKIKRHARKVLAGSLAAVFLFNSLLTAASGNIILRFARDNNLLIIIASVTLFYLFTLRRFSSRTVNYLAGYVFALYLLQGTLIRWLSPWYVPHTDSNGLILYFAGALGIICGVSISIEWVRRRLLGRIEDKLAGIAEKKLTFRP